MYLKAIMVLALFLVTIRMYRSLWRRNMKVQEPRVRTGACVLTDPSLLFRICVLKFSAMSRLQLLHTAAHGRRQDEKEGQRLCAAATHQSKGTPGPANSSCPGSSACATHSTSSLYRRSIRMSPRRLRK